MRCLDSITDSRDMSLSKLRALAMSVMGSGGAAVVGTYFRPPR